MARVRRLVCVCVCLCVRLKVLADVDGVAVCRCRSCARPPVRLPWRTYVCRSKFRAVI